MVGVVAALAFAVLKGTVLAVPATPVCMPRVPCLRPAADVVLEFRRDGVVKGRVTTAKDGSYRITLRPGSYVARVMRPTGVRRLSPGAVTLRAGQVKRLTFYFDMGIR